MTSLKNSLTLLFADAFEKSGYERKFGEVTISQRPDLCQFQCNGALAVSKKYKKNPNQVASEVLKNLTHSEIFSELSTAGPGFINIILSEKYLTSFINRTLKDERLCCPKKTSKKNIIIDYGGPNVAKPMHVGHLRSLIIGDCLKKLFIFKGDNVTGDIHLGDWGTQMGMLICEVKHKYPELPYFDESFKGEYPENPPITLKDLETMYPETYARCKANKEEMAKALQTTVLLQQGNPGYTALWKHFVKISVNELKIDLQSLKIDFDLWLGESHYFDKIPAMIDRLKASGHAIKSEGALIVPLTINDKSSPLLLVKSDGGYLYGTTDLATIEDRVNHYKADEILYVVDKRQSLHLKQVFLASKDTNIAPDTLLEHIEFGTVNGPDKKPFKTRAGGVMRLKDLIGMAITEADKRMKETGLAQDYGQEKKKEIARKVGIAAIKFADLVHNRKSDYVFNLEKFTRFEGKTGSYVVYTSVRIKSILRKVKEKSFEAGEIIAADTDAEKNLMLELIKLPDVIDSAYQNRAPHFLCEFLFNLAQTFSSFYEECHILREEDEAKRGSWISLLHLTLKEFELVFQIIGIESVERM